MIEYLLKCGALPDEDDDRTTPLIIASAHGHADCVTLLIDSDADVNRIDEKGRNCIDIAIDIGSRYDLNIF